MGLLQQQWLSCQQGFENSFRLVVVFLAEPSNVQPKFPLVSLVVMALGFRVTAYFATLTNHLSARDSDSQILSGKVSLSSLRSAISPRPTSANASLPVSVRLVLAISAIVTALAAWVHLALAAHGLVRLVHPARWLYRTSSVSNPAASVAVHRVGQVRFCFALRAKRVSHKPALKRFLPAVFADGVVTINVAVRFYKPFDRQVLLTLRAGLEDHKQRMPPGG
jgi:hypothetical protein